MTFCINSMITRSELNQMQLACTHENNRIQNVRAMFIKSRNIEGVPLKDDCALYHLSEEDVGGNRERFSGCRRHCDLHHGRHFTDDELHHSPVEQDCYDTAEEYDYWKSLLQ